MNDLTPPALLVLQADPGASYRAQQAGIDAAIARAMASGWYILGNEGRAFEAEFAAWLGVPCGVGCGNGTDAVALALRGAGIGPGMSVATVSHTAVGTVAAIEMIGAVPVLLDIEANFYTMDPAELAHVLARPPAGAPPVRAVVAVNLYGQMAALEEIAPLCASHGAILIEDCAQAHGATLGGRKAGTVGLAGTFSFYPTKNLGGFGDGGLVATSDAGLAERMSALRQYGWRGRQVSELAGMNSRLDELQAAILRAKLPHLDAANARRQAIAARYDEALAGGPWQKPARRPGGTHVFHQYVIRVADRAAVQARLRASGIATGIHYAVPVHLQPAYAGRVACGPAGCAASAQAASEVLSLPIHPELTDAQVSLVCAALRELF